MLSVKKDLSMRELKASLLTTWIGKETLHIQKQDNGKVTCEILWLANSKAGDYHKNMTSEMFMQWVEKNHCMVSFKKPHPTAKMVLVAKSAPPLPSLAADQKFGLPLKIEIIGHDGDWDFDDVPPSGLRYSALDLGNVKGATDMGGYL
jgi:hypothetical protein